VLQKRQNPFDFPEIKKARHYNILHVFAPEKKLFLSSSTSIIPSNHTKKAARQAIKKQTTRSL
jgi:hypothetical protein